MEEEDPRHVLEVQKIFDDTEAAKNFMKKYNEENYTEFIVSSNCKKSLIFSCKHSIYRDSRSTGERVKHHFNYLACPAKIRMYKSQNPTKAGSVKITQMNLEHSHPICKEIFENQNVVFTDEEKDLIATLKAANAKNSQIQRVLFERTKKKVSVIKFKNLIQRIMPAEGPEETKKAFGAFLENIESEGGVVDWIDDDDARMKAMFITSSKMKATFRACNPPLIQTDTSFNVEKARYKLAAFCYLDTNLDKTGIAAFALISEESKECFEFVLEHLSKICCRQDLTFIIDKDFTEMTSIKKVFPMSIILLCVFHCLKFMRTLFSTIPGVVEVKEEVMDQFKKVLYSQTEEIFAVENEKFMKLVENLEIRTGGKYVNLKNYYVKNWLSCKLMWVKCFRKNLPLLGDNTTNRIENKFGVLKKSIEERFATLPDTCAAFIHLVQHADRLMEEKYEFLANKRLRIFSSNEKIRHLNEEASYKLNEKGCKVFDTTLNSLEKKRNKLKNVGGDIEERFEDGRIVTYKTNVISCSCSAFASFQAPCVHIVFHRELENLADPSKKIF